MWSLPPRAESRINRRPRAAVSCYQFPLDRLWERSTLNDRLLALLGFFAHSLELLEQMTVKVLDLVFYQRQAGGGGEIGQRVDGMTPLLIHLDLVCCSAVGLKMRREREYLYLLCLWEGGIQQVLGWVGSMHT